MNPEHDKALCETYPLLFKKRTKSSAPISWGVECADGWYTLIDVLCRMLYLDYAAAERAHAALLRKGHDVKAIEAARLKVLAASKKVPVVLQVKSKFGGLRFHARGGTDVHGAYILMAEVLSTRTCEVCGAPGQRRATDWIRTLCDVHDAECAAGGAASSGAEQEVTGRASE